MSAPRPDERERALEAAAREYGRLLTFGERNTREQIELKHGELMPELAARLDDVEELLGTPTRPQTSMTAAAAVQRQQMLGREWRSRSEFLGWPLVHVASGLDPETGKMRVAKGVIAVGNIAIGGIAMGGFAVGGVTIGGFSLGVLSLGGIAAGGLALGGLSIGVVAVGGLAVGLIAMGGFAVGQYAAGGNAAGSYVLTGRIQDPEAKALFTAIRDTLRGLVGR